MYVTRVLYTSRIFEQCRQLESWNISQGTLSNRHDLFSYTCELFTCFAKCILNSNIFSQKLLESYFGKVSPFYFIKTLQINHAFLKNKNKKIKRKKKNQIHSILLTAIEKLCHRQNCVITWKAISTTSLNYLVSSLAERRVALCS